MTMNHFKGKQFQQDVIIVAVGYYLRYNLIHLINHLPFHGSGIFLIK